MVAAILERGGRAPRPQPRRREHGRRGRRRAAGGRAARRGDRRRRRAVRGRRVLARTGSSPQLRPRALLLANLFRDQLDRYGELETIADRWAQVVAGACRRPTLVLNADDPLDRRPRPRPRGRRGRRVLRRRGPGDRAGRHGARRRLQALPPLRRAVRLRRGLPRPPRPLPLRRCGASAARRRRSRPSASCSTGCAARASRCARRRGPSDVRLPLPGLYNVYNALGAAALALALGAPLADVVAGLEAVSPAFGRAEAVRLGGREVLLLLVKNPAGRQRGPAHADARGRRARRAGGPQRQHRRRPRRLAGCGTRTSRCSPGALRRVVCSGTRAAEMALRLKYAGVPEDRLVVEPELSVALDRAVAGTPQAPGAPGRAPDLHGDARAARAARRPRRRSGAASDEPGRPCWHDVECGGLRRGPRAVARAGRRRARARRRRRHRARRRSTSPRAGMRSSRSTPTRELLAALRERAAGPAGARPCCADARALRPRRPALPG